MNTELFSASQHDFEVAFEAWMLDYQQYPEKYASDFEDSPAAYGRDAASHFITFLRPALGPQ